MSILLDKEVLDYFRAGGSDWHSRINDALRKATSGDGQTSE